MQNDCTSFLFIYVQWVREGRIYAREIPNAFKKKTEKKKKTNDCESLESTFFTQIIKYLTNGFLTAAINAGPAHQQLSS